MLVTPRSHAASHPATVCSLTGMSSPPARIRRMTRRPTNGTPGMTRKFSSHDSDGSDAIGTVDITLLVGDIDGRARRDCSP